MSRLPARLVFACVLSASLAGAAASRQAGQVFRQAVDIVTVDVAVVNASGDAVTDLTAADFDVLVDGSPRPIVAFRRTGPVRSGHSQDVPGIPSGSSAAMAMDAAGTSERLFVLLVDRGQIRPTDGRDFLRAAAAFVDEIDPADHVAVWTLPSLTRELELGHDREALKKVLLASTGTAAPPPVMHTMTPDEVVAIAFHRDREALEQVVTRECGRLQNAGPTCAEEILDEARRRYPEMSVQSRAALDSLERLFGVLRSFDGPKHLVYITPGPHQTPDVLDTIRRVGQEADAARVHVHAVQIPQRPQAVRADEMGRPPPRINHQATVAYALADATGGLAVTPSDPRVAFRQLARGIAGSYEIGFEPIAADRDGRPHRIEVRVPGRRGLSVRARRQFTLAPRSEPLMSTAPPATVPPPVAADDGGVSALPPGAGRAEVAPPLAARRSIVDLLGLLGQHVDRFEREFSSAVTEERYVQLVRPWVGRPSWPPREAALEWQDGRGAYKRSGPIIERRQLLSDVLLAQTREGWVGYRDVAIVDGRSVRRRDERVSRLFLSAAAERADQLRRIAEESARYNVGGFHRTLNLPTLPLAFLHPRHHSRYLFSSGGADMLDGHATEVLVFEEHSRPTLIGTPAGEDVPIAGRVWLDADTGDVRQTEVTLETGGRRGTLVTRYRAEPGFDVLVPDYMWEWYDGGYHGGRLRFGSAGAVTIVECLARYGNYRRFRVETEETLR